MELLDHLQFPLQPPQGLNVKHQGLAGVGYLVLHKHHPLHSLVEVGGKLGLGLGATLTNRYHPLVVLERYKSHIRIPKGLVSKGQYSNFFWPVLY